MNITYLPARPMGPKVLEPSYAGTLCGRIRQPAKFGRGGKVRCTAFLEC